MALYVEFDPSCWIFTVRILLFQIYSSGNPTNIENPIMDARVQIDIKTDGGRLTLYQTSMCEKIGYSDIHANLDPDNLLNAYNMRDIQIICCQEDASSSWMVPSVVQNRFIRSIDYKMQLIFSWVLTRDRPKGKETVKYESSCGLQCANTSAVKDVLNGTADSFRIEDIYFRFFQVTGSGEVRVLKQSVCYVIHCSFLRIIRRLLMIPLIEINNLRQCSLIPHNLVCLQRNSVAGDISLNKGSPSWWSFRDVHAPDVEECAELTGPMAIIVSEETPPRMYHVVY